VPLIYETDETDETDSSRHASAVRAPFCKLSVALPFLLNYTSLIAASTTP
jgi:hypothetical protein